MFTVAVGGVTVAGFENEEDTDGDQGETDDRSHPVEALVLGEAVDEQTNGQPDSSEEGAVQTGFGSDLSIGVLGEGLVLANLEEVQGETDGGTEAQRDVGETGNTFVPAALLLEGDGDHGQEKESQEPGEGNPQTKGEHSGLGEEHLDGLDGGVVEHVLDTGSLDIVVGDEAVVTGSLADLLRTLGKADTATGLGKAQSDDNTQGNVGKTLDTLEPAPAKSLVDETGVDGGTDCTENGDEREAGHGDGTVFRGIHIAEGTTDENGTDTTEQTEKRTTHKNRGDVLTESETDEHQAEADVGTDVDDTATSQLTEWSKEERGQCTSEVETEQTELTDFSGSVEFYNHLADTRAVCSCSETDEECHQTKLGCDKRLSAAAPVERVFLISFDKVEHDVLLAIVFLGFRGGQREVNVDFLQKAAIEFLGLFV